jgi:hypothetical protein
VIRRRHVLYVEGYDPQGAEGYYKLFRRSWTRVLKLWPMQAKLGALQIDSDEFAHWDIEASGPNWRTETRYDFLRQEQMIRANMAEPLWLQVPRAIGWTADYLFGGAMARVFRASWQYACVLLFFQAALLLWITSSIVAGWYGARAAHRLGGVPEWLAVALGVAAAVAVFLLLRRLADRFFVVQINSHWPHLLEYARGKPSCFDAPIEAGARRLVALAQAKASDEILVIGHSGGCVLAPALVVRALELDPDLGRHGPRIVLLSLGSIMPGAAVHPQAVKLRGLVKRLAVEPSVLWIDAQSRHDVMNFRNFDPVGGIGVHSERERCNPLIWTVNLRRMLSREFLRRRRFDFFRLHYQFIMANEKRAPYDYFLLTAGPVAVEEWARHGDEVMAAFAPDMTYDR